MDNELQNLLPADKFEIWTQFCDLVESLYEMERKLDTTKCKFERTNCIWKKRERKI